MHPSTQQYVNSEPIARDYDLHFAANRLFDFDAQVLDAWLPQPGRLIDLGCGTGRHLLQFARRGFDVVGLDLSGHMLQQTHRKLSQANLAAQMLCFDLNRLATPQPAHHPELPAASFDYAICMFSTLGLIKGHDRRLRVLQGIRRLLKPTGALALHVHNRTHNWLSHEGRAFLLSNFLAVKRGRAEPGDKVLGHYRGIRDMYVHVFTEDEIRSLLETAGFDVLDVLALNQQRNGPLRPNLWRRLRANGFLIRARPHD